MQVRGIECAAAVIPDLASWDQESTNEPLTLIPGVASNYAFKRIDRHGKPRYTAC